ncbi:MAG: response regulator [Thermodesulfovibrionales bacterium]|nr:response regulator [Thermodesulfovibrionales bacterium]
MIVIDDIKNVLDKENSFLDRSGIELYPVPSNAEALLVHREIKADLIITYLDMPDMSGEDFCEAVRKDVSCSKVSIIMVCPSRCNCDERLKACRADAFIQPPVSADVLLSQAHLLLHIPSRADFRVPVSVRIMGEGEGEMKPFLGFSENISVSGMLLGSDRKLAMGTELSISFMLGGKELMRTEATVMRAKDKPKEGAPNRYGLRFKGVTPDVATDIDRLVRGLFEKK